MNLVLYGWSGPSFTDFVNNNTTLFVEDWYQDIPGYPVYRYTKEAIRNSKKTNHSGWKLPGPCKKRHQGKKLTKCTSHAP